MTGKDRAEGNSRRARDERYREKNRERRREYDRKRQADIRAELRRLREQS